MPQLRLKNHISFMKFIFYFILGFKTIIFISTYNKESFLPCIINHLVISPFIFHFYFNLYIYDAKLKNKPKEMPCLIGESYYPSNF